MMRDSLRSGGTINSDQLRDAAVRRARSLSPLSMSELLGGPGSTVRFLSRKFSMRPSPTIEMHALDVESPSATIQRKVGAWYSLG